MISFTKERKMSMAVTTNTLLKRIVGGKDFEKVLEHEKNSFEEQSIAKYLNQLCDARGRIPEQVIKKAQIDRTYGHQIFNGTRQPSRDKLIQLAFGFGLSRGNGNESSGTGNRGFGCKQKQGS